MLFRSISPKDPWPQTLQSSIQISALQRDVKGLTDQQTRLLRVIEDVSQELTQRLAKHDVQLVQLAEKQQSLQERVVLSPNWCLLLPDKTLQCALFSAPEVYQGSSRFLPASSGRRQETFRQLQSEQATWFQSLEAEYLRLRTSDGNFANQLNFLESKIQQLEARPEKCSASKKKTFLGNRWNKRVFFSIMAWSVAENLPEKKPGRMYRWRLNQGQDPQDRPSMRRVAVKVCSFFQIQTIETWGSLWTDRLYAMSLREKRWPFNGFRIGDHCWDPSTTRCKSCARTSKALRLGFRGSWVSSWRCSWAKSSKSSCRRMFNPSCNDNFNLNCRTRAKLGHSQFLVSSRRKCNTCTCCDLRDEDVPGLKESEMKRLFQEGRRALRYGS